ncbi:alpha/beta hydrolase [Saccharopolyspora rosea]|uniref:Acyl-CoA:diacylglycerol acyltransferase n=1 Tax=Saccharopolyspora rosea TaxID=524884 RepID=A0ABW3G1L9_9PSEU|nr:esterase family protein [Saccharopolyspora rosea]
MRGPAFGRRRLLSMAGVVAAGAAACSAPQSPPRPSAPPPAVDPAASGTGMPEVRTEQVRSAHRGTDVQLYVAHPTGLPDTANLPVVLYLHGRDGVHPTPIPYGTLAALEREHASGSVPPFGFVVVDGGFNPYWTDGSRNGDLAAMLRDEVPRWLRERGLADDDGLPFAVAGISTGGFGALDYAADRNLAGRPPAAAAVLAPALPTSWDHMREKDAFATEDEWRAHDPLERLADLGDVPVGVWIGDADPFLDGTRRLVDGHDNTPVVSYLPGGHGPEVFEAVGPDMVTFLGKALPNPA